MWLTNWHKNWKAPEEIMVSSSGWSGTEKEDRITVYFRKVDKEPTEYGKKKESADLSMTIEEAEKMISQLQFAIDSVKKHREQCPRKTGPLKF